MTEKIDSGLIMDQVTLKFSSPDEEGELEVLDKVSLKVAEGEFVGIVGPSGCGKTTLLNIVAGFQSIQEGSVVHNGLPISKPSPERAVVFQSAVLFPWLSVYDNVAYGLKRAKVSKKMIKSTVREHLQMVGMAGFENYTPGQLSGGMQQRVAFARALALKPRMLLLDEPFASLDAQTRVIMQELLQDIHREYQTTTLLVTHDVEEALFLADKIYVLSKRPARVIEEFDVPFARPRGLTLRGEAGFAELKAALLKKIREQF